MATTTSTTNVGETHFSRLWRKDGNLRYGVAMTNIIITLNIAAIVYINMTKPKIHVDDLVLEYVLCFGMFYMTTIMLSCACWFMAMDHDEDAGCYLAGRIGHTLGFSMFLGFLYAISPRLALYFGLPCLLWFIPAMIAPWFPCGTWWNFAKQPQPQPQSTVADIV
ncbi:unnamed protein product [Microthlaspi erraticum]|uniref:Uncharacterized protein n=1 Tax=Microthlaspi erraticum TaxID=1685480 RepID=A0A6D2KQ16_9BRAS|nr:unnamed protein product [Microthlaspi erraticum]